MALESYFGVDSTCGLRSEELRTTQRAALIVKGTVAVGASENAVGVDDPGSVGDAEDPASVVAGKKVVADEKVVGD